MSCLILIRYWKPPFIILLSASHRPFLRQVTLVSTETYHRLLHSSFLTASSHLVHSDRDLTFRSKQTLLILAFHPFLHLARSAQNLLLAADYPRAVTSFFQGSAVVMLEALVLVH